MHNLETRTLARTMCRIGLPNAEIARHLDVPKGTIGAWKFRDREKHPDLYPLTRKTTLCCPICDAGTLDEVAYSYLLGLYLGDGCILKPPAHRVYTLTIACCDAWPGLIEAAEDCFAKIIPYGRAFRVQRTGMTEVKAYSSHWPCLFPQHGPGKKHNRKIELAGWQRTIVEEHPQDFIRGLIHSDGCRITNWTTRVVAGEIKRYEYPRYFFSNYSADIRELFCWALDLVGVEWRYNNPHNISVAKRASVALMDTFVGPKY
jgi:Putative ATPase subunit of terminase (gpP-like)